MYKNSSFKKVRGFKVLEFLEDGWTLEPKTTPTPKRSRNKIVVKEVDVIKQDLGGPEDLTTTEEQ